MHKYWDKQGDIVGQWKSDKGNNKMTRAASAIALISPS
jgi:hypothetical protein